MRIKEIIKGIVGNKPSQEQTAEETVKQQPVQQGKQYSLEETCLAEALGIPAGLVANWRTGTMSRYLSPKYNCDVMETLRGFKTVAQTKEEVLQQAIDFVEKNFTVEKSSGDRVSISLTTTPKQDMFARETRVSGIDVKSTSRINIPTGNQHEAYVVHYSDKVETISKNQSTGAFTIKSGVENIGRQVFKPTEEGDYYCTEIINCNPNNEQDCLLTAVRDLEYQFDVINGGLLTEESEKVRVSFPEVEVTPGMETPYCLTCSHKAPGTNRISINNQTESTNFDKLEENSGLSLWDLPRIHGLIMNQDSSQGTSGLTLQPTEQI